MRQRDAARRPHRRADRLELQAAAGKAPIVSWTPTTPCPPSSCAFGRHPPDRLPARLVQRLDHAARTRPATAARHRGDAPVRRDVATASAGPGPRAGEAAGVADVVDRRAEHLADRLEPDAPDRGELVRGQRGPPGAAVPDLGHPGLGGRRQPDRRYGRSLTPHALSAGSAALLTLPASAHRPGAGRLRAGRASVAVLASHSSFRRWTVSRARAAASRVGYGPSRSLPGQSVVCSDRLCLRQNHHCCSSSMATRLPDHGNLAPARPDFTMRQVPGAHPAPEYVGKKRPADRGAGRQGRRRRSSGCGSPGGSRPRRSPRSAGTWRPA